MSDSNTNDHTNDNGNGNGNGEDGEVRVFSTENARSALSERGWRNVLLGLILAIVLLVVAAVLCPPVAVGHALLFRVAETFFLLAFGSALLCAVLFSFIGCGRETPRVATATAPAEASPSA